MKTLPFLSTLALLAAGLPASAQALEPAPAPAPSFHGDSARDAGRDRHALALPDTTYWEGRDLLMELRDAMRRGPVPVTAVGAGVKELQDFAAAPGWKAYGFTVPARGTLQVRLEHPNEGWFRLLACDRQGRPDGGALPNPALSLRTVLKYRNPTDEARAVYVIADDPDSMSSKARPYKLLIEQGGAPPAQAQGLGR